MRRLVIQFVFALVTASFAMTTPVLAQETQPYLVFFDSGKPSLTPDATQSIDALLRTASVSARWQLVGFTDRSGPSGANQRVSIGRARSVEGYLVAHGVQTGRIETVGRGEESPLIPTQDGVREPQNRRVEIRIVP